MNQIQALTDKTAIGLSVLCVIHCLLLPIALVMIPSLGALGMDNEHFHIWMVIAVIPTSLYALTLGCKKHNRYQLMIFGIVGLACLITALMIGHDFLGEIGEVALTVLGALLISYGHYRNLLLCKAEVKQKVDCDCSEQRNQQA